MISKDFKIDAKKKTIAHNARGTKKIYTINELYSYLQNLFDEPKYMKYEVPMEAKSKTKYQLINGWSIDEKSMKYLEDGTLDPEDTIKH